MTLKVSSYIYWCVDCISRYSTVYTMYPVFSLVLDKDVTPETALMYPELYKDLTKVCISFVHLSHNNLFTLYCERVF